MEPTLQIGIQSAPTINFTLNQRYTATNGFDYDGCMKADFKNGKICFLAKEYDEICFTPTTTSASFDLSDVLIGKDFHWQQKENQRFNGSLKIIIENNQLTAINLISIESYLGSVISSEMSANASEELLKAHAVISRSWVMHACQSKKNNNDSFIQNKHRIVKWYERDTHTHYDVCADDHCQRYQGITRITNQKVLQAVESTRGEVLVYEGEICDARFSKSCGGATELFENCWSDSHHNYLEMVIDAQNQSLSNTNLTVEENAKKWISDFPDTFCNTKDSSILSQVLNAYDQSTNNFFRWEIEYTQTMLSNLLFQRSGIDFGEISDLVPLKRGTSGRIIELKIIGSKRTLVVGKELEIRKWLSTSHLYSSAFIVEKDNIMNGIPQSFTIRGAGWGHGVGLCQIGAAVMATKGYNYLQILNHYYQKARIKKLYE